MLPPSHTPSPPLPFWLPRSSRLAKKRDRPTGMLTFATTCVESIFRNHYSKRMPAGGLYRYTVLVVMPAAAHLPGPRRGGPSGRVALGALYRSACEHGWQGQELLLPSLPPFFLPTRHSSGSPSRPGSIAHLPTAEASEIEERERGSVCVCLCVRWDAGAS